MKAKDYLEEFGQQLIDSENDADKSQELLDQLVSRFNADMYETLEKRHIRVDKGVAPLLKEFNDKWNALVSLMEKEYGHSPIARNGYRAYWLDAMPSLWRALA